MVKVAINGFGRIGRNALKILLERRDAQVVAINDITDAKTLAHLLKHDSTYGTYDKKVSAGENSIIINSREIPVFAEKEPAKLPWGDLGVDVVIESTGFFTKPEDARAHIKAGAKKVVISAPAKGEGAKTVVLGVNEDVVDGNDEILSNASCTTNCIAPVMKVLEDLFGIEKLLLEGGSILNGAFNKVGIIDEISLVVVPITGSTLDKPLFYEGNVENYKLVSSKTIGQNVILNYKR